MRDMHIRNAKVFIIVFSITNRSSFNELYDYHDQILRVKDEDWIPCVLMGAKSDLENQRVISKSEAQEMAARWKIPYIETSSKLNENIFETFSLAIEELKKFEIFIEKRQRQSRANRRKNGKICELM